MIHRAPREHRNDYAQPSAHNLDGKEYRLEYGARLAARLCSASR